jgi:hypothetical protein
MVIGGIGVGVGVEVEVGVGVANRFFTACGTIEQLIEIAANIRMMKRAIPTERLDIRFLR